VPAEIDANEAQQLQKSEKLLQQLEAEIADLVTHWLLESNSFARLRR
jgi:hypothetical protein